MAGYTSGSAGAVAHVQAGLKQYYAGLCSPKAYVPLADINEQYRRRICSAPVMPTFADKPSSRPQSSLDTLLPTEPMRPLYRASPFGYGQN